MSDRNEIIGFKIEHYGNVELMTREKNGEVTHKYWNVSRDIIKKFINSSKAPTLKDFDEWVETERKKREESRDEPCCINGCGFWGS